MVQLRRWCSARQAQAQGRALPRILPLSHRPGCVVSSSSRSAASWSSAGARYRPFAWRLISIWSGSSGKFPDVQIFDVLRLLRGRFIRHRMVPRFYNGIVEALEAAVHVVALLATVVGLHYNSV
jgi:hypothetical protein